MRTTLLTLLAVLPVTAMAFTSGPGLPPVSVPDAGSSVVLLSGALLGLAALRSMRRK